MTRPVAVQTMTVSMKGSKSATSPSLIGSFVFAAEWAIEAEPTPASLENAARRMPITNVPITPPRPAWLVKAEFTMSWKLERILS